MSWANGETRLPVEGFSMPRHRRLAALAAMSTLALALGAAPVSAGSPAVHFSFDPTGVVLDCGATHYTVMSGTIVGVGHGNELAGHETFRASNVLVQKNDGGNGPAGPSYRMVGAETHGMEAAMWTGSHAAGATYDYNILGTGDSIHAVVHVDLSSPAGFYVTSRGTCNPPG